MDKDEEIEWLYLKIKAIIAEMEAGYDDEAYKTALDVLNHINRKKGNK